ncbi:MAG: threonylcarbamoyl-AMP synthase [Nanoarchaeota archaeon]|nr:threonylcarbamoyl-AMP synthase [Nanoarchaeota archaeon]MBU1444805.1 threonylcarbamoyl-AMP synthase [Nanoarchaeota archaeon]MBU2406838.1 threonylcarbamoyl-AMP synthase [Nanoarchaeota archaeon]MBU2420541.1 threonylcarbamoyl-AMP synthase [Nanoarchaeota archaeon]MBU2475621.1 threonylcarbamoyl-AMP synthase [Nanoarchaeota archaeon]
MPEFVSMQEIDKKEAVNAIKKGAVFVYPTDTVYGLGCNALDGNAIERIRDIKRNWEQPFSVIAPNIRWIQANLHTKNNYLKKLPGPFTFIFKTKKKCVDKSVNFGKKTLGVRFPDHGFVELIKRAKVPFITTSVNLHGEKPLRDIKHLSNSIAKKVDYVVDDGYLHNYPSTVIDLTGKIAKIIRR